MNSWELFALPLVDEGGDEVDAGFIESTHQGWMRRPHRRQLVPNCVEGHFFACRRTPT